MNPGNSNGGSAQVLRACRIRMKLLGITQGQCLLVNTMVVGSGILAVGDGEGRNNGTITIRR